MAISMIALFVALGGSAAAVVSTVNNAKHLGGKPPTFFLRRSRWIDPDGLPAGP